MKTDDSFAALIITVVCSGVCQHSSCVIFAPCLGKTVDCNPVTSLSLSDSVPNVIQRTPGA